MVARMKTQIRSTQAKMRAAESGCTRGARPAGDLPASKGPFRVGVVTSALCVGLFLFTVGCNSGQVNSGNGADAKGKSGHGADSQGKKTGKQDGAGDCCNGSKSATKKAEENASAKSTGSNQEDTITAEMRTNGFVNASSFQVFVTAFGSSESEAREAGLTEGRRKALNLMRTDPVLQNKALSGSSARELKRVIQESSRILALRREPNGSWSVVIRVEKEGLKAFLRRLR